MSDTPISDSTPHNVAELGMLCRQLERELNAANELIVRLQAVVNDPHALWANWLRGSVALPVGIGDVRKYEDRIKRLEREIELFRYHADYGDVCLVEAILKGEEIGRKEKEVKL